MRRLYIHQRPEWPRFFWDLTVLAHLLADVRHRQGRLIGQMNALGFDLRQEAVFQILTTDVLKTSEIEGERLNTEQVRSSVARQLGIDVGALSPTDRHVEGLVEMILDATRNYEDKLTAERLFAWHAAMFPTGRSGLTRIRAGDWRNDKTGPMQVISGPKGRERVHYEAPAAGLIPREMEAFLSWFNQLPTADGVLHAGIAHLWFVTIHPFDDGNGRIARAIADMALARSEDSPQRFYSMSAQIRQERDTYYRILEQTQCGTLDITRWLEWFVDCLGCAIDGAQLSLERILAKARFWKRVQPFGLNSRQTRVVNRLLDGFEGKLTTSKYAKIAKCSNDTALRDITFLIQQGVLERGPEGGRSTSYTLSVPAE